MSKSRVRRLLVTLASLLTFLLLAATALAAGRVQWKSKVFKEREDKSWRLELAIFLPRAPDVAYVPMKFEFEPLVYYERAMVDGRSEPVESRVPLEGRQPMIETVEVGFLETGDAKIQSRTRFTFKVKRDLGYEAGEYKVTVRDTRDGKVIGTATTITFDGVNEVIDRRSIVFSGEKKKKKDEKKDGEGAAEAKQDEGGDSGGTDESEGSSSDDTSSDDSGDEGMGDEGPPPIEEKPGGCGCRTPGSASSSNAALLAWLGLGALLLRRRPG